jgi:hypothetical protein
MIVKVKNIVQYYCSIELINNGNKLSTTLNSSRKSSLLFLYLTALFKKNSDSNPVHPILIVIVLVE